LKDEHVADREIPVEIVFLRRKPDRAPRFAPIGLAVVTEDADRAGVGSRETDDRIDRRRLPRTVRPEKTEELTGFDAQRNAVDRGEVAVAFDQVVDLDSGCGYGTNPLSRL
jgi:hypothetical protein